MPFDIFGKLKELGYETCPENFYSHISKWKEWYDGDVKTFHHYKCTTDRRRSTVTDTASAWLSAD